MGEQGWVARSWRAMVGILLLAGLPVAAWFNDGRGPKPMTTCEATADMAKRAVEGSALARMAALRIIHLGDAVPMDGAEVWLPVESYGCRAPVITSVAGRDVLIWRIDPAPELGAGHVLVRAVIGEEMTSVLRDRR